MAVATTTKQRIMQEWRHSKCLRLFYTEIEHRVIRPCCPDCKVSSDVNLVGTVEVLINRVPLVDRYSRREAKRK